MAFRLRASPKQDCMGIPTSPLWLEHLPTPWCCCEGNLWEGGPTKRSLETYSERVVSSLTPWVLTREGCYKKSRASLGPLTVSRKHCVLMSSTSALTVSLPPLPQWSLSRFFWLEVNYVFLWPLLYAMRGCRHEVLHPTESVPRYGLWASQTPSWITCFFMKRYFSSDTRLTGA